MSYCQNCGAEVHGNFCPNCGTQVGTPGRVSQRVIIHENSDVKPLFSLGHMILAGYLGVGFMGGAFIWLALMLPEMSTFTPFEQMLAGIGALFFLGMAILSYLPAIKAICQRAPEGKVMKYLGSFFVKSVLFLFSWCLTIALCVYIIGIFFRVWRFGMWTTYPAANQYVVFKDGKKIPVTRYEDNLIGYGANTDYIYQDANGVYYRPRRG